MLEPVLLLIATIAAAICAALFFCVQCGERPGKILRTRPFLLFAAVLFACGWTLALAVRQMTLLTLTPADPQRILSAADLLLIFAVAVFGIAGIRFFVRGVKIRRVRAVRTRSALFFADAAVIALVILVLEISLFNYRSFQPAVFGADAVRYDASNLSSYNGIQDMGDGRLVVLEQGAALTIPGINRQVVSLVLETDGSRRAMTVGIGITDEAYSGVRWVGPHTVHELAEGSKYIAVVSNGKADEITITFHENTPGLVVRSVGINFARPFGLNRLRMVCFAAAGWGISAVLRFKIWRKRYRSGSRAQNRAFACAAVLMCALCAFTFVTSAAPEKLADGRAFLGVYRGNAHSMNDIYHQQLDGWIKGQLHLDLDAEPLATLENPYDPAQRDAAQAAYYFDRAYYNGKYYSYFGVAPMILYGAAYLATGGLLSTGVVALIYAVQFMIAGLFALRRGVDVFLPGRPVRFLPVLAGYFSLAGAGAMLYCLRSSNFYYIAQMAAVANFAVFLAFFFSAYLEKRAPRRITLLTLAGVFFVLTVASRANWALYGIAVLPLLWKMLADWRRPARVRLGYAVGFAAPIVVGAAALMVYNALRFGSPFEFGAVYQLTVSDIRFNRLFQPEKLVPALYHYFLQPVTVHGYFPFVRPYMHYQLLEQNYYFNNPSAGAFVYPSLILSLGAAGGFRRRGVKTGFSHGAVLCIFFWVAALTALINFSLAGSLLRYTADITFILALVSALVACGISAACKIPNWIKTVNLVLCVTMMASFVIGLLLSFVGEYDRFLQEWPALYLNLRHTFEWWY